jgi:hypothetical protein
MTDELEPGDWIIQVVKLNTGTIRSWSTLLASSCTSTPIFGIVSFAKSDTSFTSRFRHGEKR